MTDNKDPAASLHNNQRERALTVLDMAKKEAETAQKLATFYYWVCHFFAFIGWASGMSVTGTCLSGTDISNAIGIFLGLLASIYPAGKYLDIEGRRTQANNTVIFCMRVRDKISDVTSTMNDALTNGVFSAKWDAMVSFISLTQQNMQQLQLGAIDLQTAITNFALAEKDQSAVPMPGHGTTETTFQGVTIKDGAIHSSV